METTPSPIPENICRRGGAIANIPTEFLVSELPCPFYSSFSMEHLAESSILKEIKQCVALWPGFHQHLPKTESATSMDAATDQEFYPRPPDVTEVQEKAIHRKACELVAAAVLEQESPQDSTLEDAASQKLMGCFLTLKR